MAGSAMFDLLTNALVSELKPFVKRILYILIRASLDRQLTLSEAAKLMGVNRDTLKKRCQRGSFPYSKVGEVYYISMIDVNLYVKGGNQELEKFYKEFDIDPRKQK